MIGDYVTRQNYENKVVICKIIGLSKNSISVEFDNGSRSMGASEDSINPISLTPEILEKNGWKSYSHENTPIYGMIKGFEIVLAWMDYYWQLCIDGIIYRKIKIRYVHELQLALKLCGIEKTIEL